MRRVFGGKLVEEALRRKEHLRSLVGSKLDDEQRRRAIRDPHARRRPRPCGMTIHTSIGCSFGCIYCYVPDMGFPMKPRPYPLEPLELVYALLHNEYIVPGRWGTLMAFGSVTEPFQPEAVERTLGYMDAIRRYMDNPIQFSTKASISDEVADMILEASRGVVDALITIVTLTKHRILEPGAPPPSERLGTAERLSRRGLHVTLFLRPIIPCVVSASELRRIVLQAARHGVRGVVAGSLRVTRGILDRLRLKGLRIDCILSRLPRQPRGREQVPIQTADLKRVVLDAASTARLKFYPSACASSVEAHAVSCYMCRHGPCGDPSKLPVLDEDGVRDAVEYFGLRPLRIDIGRFTIRVEVAGRRVAPWVSEVLSTLSKRRFILVGHK